MHPPEYWLPALLLIVLTLGIYTWYRERKLRYKPYYKVKNNTNSTESYPQVKPKHSICLVGDTGNITDPVHDPVANLINTWLNENATNGTLIFLGDNVYPIGLPPVGHKTRAIAEKRLKAQLDLVREYTGQVFFISGNHDWNKGRSNGLEYVLRQEEYITKYLNRPHCYLPSGGCPGPVVRHLSEGVMLIFINTQWWVQKGIRPIGKTYNCSTESEADFFRQLEDLLQLYPHKQIVIAAHHPLYSNAMHGGKFTLKQHVFPLTAAHKKFYVPLPLAGSIYPVYRKLYGPEEDMSNPRYRRLRKRLLRLFHQHKNIVYASGHDHNLQYFAIKNNHYLVSGSGSKTAFVQSGGRATFVHENKGFFVLDYFEPDNIWLSALEPAPANAADKYIIAFRRKINAI
ncbi:metallophosphoesterase [Adhaeribacter swui]|uniref:Metallophosphoesterase n=1 Tax=Adhaeribacter swui TaxID=2086471 RepID=A0A7G7GCZ6_9BACT|nr:metallophosphoesterase [Adhaeribacter swui]QNF35030.1 metallophosphoesterase [Adhaeribacter swui]